MEYKTFKGTPLKEIIKKLPPINNKTDAINYGLFETYGTSNSGELRHTCVLCNKKCSIADTISSRGHKLICIPCVYRYFDGDYSAVFVWNREEYNEDILERKQSI